MGSEMCIRDRTYNVFLSVSTCTVEYMYFYLNFVNLIHHPNDFVDFPSTGVWRKEIAVGKYLDQTTHQLRVINRKSCVIHLQKVNIRTFFKTDTNVYIDTHPLLRRVSQTVICLS